MEAPTGRSEFLQAVRSFVEAEIAPRARELDATGVFPRELVSKLAAQKYLGALAPRSLGGLELDPVTYGFLLETVSRHCGNTRNFLTIQVSIVGECLLRHGRKDQVERWLPKVLSGERPGAFSITEPEVGSDARNILTRFERNGSHYVLNGRKRFTTFGAAADFLMVAAKSDDQMGVFLVDRHSEGVSVTPIRGLLASRASHIAEIEFREVRVHETDLLGDLSTGICPVVATAFDSARYCIAWASVGLAQGALDAMMDYARKRSQFGKKIRTHQLVQELLCDATSAIHAGRALCVHAGELRQLGRKEAVLEATIAKYFCSRAAMRIATDAVQLHGANGCTSEFAVERHFREAKMLEIMEGTSQILQQVIATQALMNPD